MSLADAAKTELLRQCTRAFPARERPALTEPARISDGWECEVYSFDLQGAEAGAPRREGLILRLYPGNDGPEKSRREFDVMRRLQAAGFAVPHMLVRGDSGSALGNPFVVMERIDGQVMGPVLLGASGERRRELVSLFCRLFADLHAFDWRPFSSHEPGNGGERYIERWTATAERIVREVGRPEFLPAVAWLQRGSREVESETLALNHGDFHPWNILLRSDGQPFVIDWTQAEVADYRLDLAWTLMLMRGIVGRGLRDEVLTEYVRQAGHDVPDLGYFEAAASLRRLFGIVVSLTDSPEKVGMRPEAAERMRRQTGHLATAYQIFREQTDLAIPSVEALL